jgi:hypothetical protein
MSPESNHFVQVSWRKNLNPCDVTFNYRGEGILYGQGFRKDVAVAGLFLLMKSLRFLFPPMRFTNGGISSERKDLGYFAGPA